MMLVAGAVLPAAIPPTSAVAFGQVTRLVQEPFQFLTYPVSEKGSRLYPDPTTDFWEFADGNCSFEFCDLDGAGKPATSDLGEAQAMLARQFKANPGSTYVLVYTRYKLQTFTVSGVEEIVRRRESVHTYFSADFSVLQQVRAGLPR
jgi:hypothetical protein